MLDPVFTEARAEGPHDDETLYVIEGRFRFRAGGVEHEGGPGALLFAALATPSPDDFARLGAESGMRVVGPPLGASRQAG